MSIKFYGSLDELRAMLESNGLGGRWKREPNGVFMMRRDDGSNLHWSSTKKTIWCDGEPQAARHLAERIARVVCSIDGQVQNLSDARVIEGVAKQRATHVLPSPPSPPSQ